MDDFFHSIAAGHGLWRRLADLSHRWIDFRIGGKFGVLVVRLDLGLELLSAVDGCISKRLLWEMLQTRLEPQLL